MPQPTVTRGRITIASTGIYRPFMFNPNELTDDKGVNWGTLDMPGASHPIYQYGTGGPRQLNFTLYFDGDRGRYGREFSQDDISIQSEINFYRSLVYPGIYDTSDFAAVYPYIILFSFGAYCQSLPCIVKSPPTVKIFHWTPKLEPVRATIELGLEEVVSRSQTVQDVSPSLDVGAISIGGVMQLNPLPDGITANMARVRARSKVIRLPTTTITAGDTGGAKMMTLPPTVIRGATSRMMVGRVNQIMPTTTIRGSVPRMTVGAVTTKPVGPSRPRRV